MPPHREAKSSALDLGGYSFGDFLDARLLELKEDLHRECDRIAAARELHIKTKLRTAESQNERLQEQLQTLADGGAVVDLPIQTFTPEAADEADKADSKRLTTGSGGNTDSKIASKVENFTLWGEWKETPGTQLDEGEDLRRHESAWNQENHDEFHKSMRSRCTMSPNSVFFIFWECFGIPLLCYDLVTIPMQVFHKPDGPLFNTLAWMILLYWTLDIFLRMLVVGQITDDGTVRLERSVFMRLYIRNSLTFDFAMVMPDWFSKIVGAAVGAEGMRNIAVLRLFRLFRLLRLLRMSKMKKIFRNLEDMIDSEYFSVGVSIVNNLLAILGMCHYCGCFWFWVGTIEIDGQSSWVDQHVKDQEWSDQYVISLHWAIAQFTPGASKIQPTNSIEALGSITVLVAGLIFLSLFISALSQARMRLQALTSKIDRDNWMLRRYLRQQSVSTDLQVRTMKYVEKCLEPSFTRVQKKDVFLLPLLSRPLQLEVQEQQYFQTLIGHPLLTGLRQRSLSLTLQLFMSVIADILLADSDLLFEIGSIAHEMYFVSRGAIAYLHGGRAREIEYLSVGGWCCEAVLWVGWLYRGTAKAVSESSVISIDSAKMRAAVLEHNVRSYVSRCAAAYLQDLYALADKGESIDDLTNILEHNLSYKQVIGGENLDSIVEDSATDPNTTNEVESTPLPDAQSTPLPDPQSDADDTTRHESL